MFNAGLVHVAIPSAPGRSSNPSHLCPEPLHQRDSLLHLLGVDLVGFERCGFTLERFLATDGGDSIT